VSSISAYDASDLTVAPAPPRARPPKVAWSALGLRLGFAGYVLALVATPLGAVLWKALADGPTAFWTAVTAPAAVDAVILSCATGLLAALINAGIGTAIAWWIVRWRLPGTPVVSALVDLPLAIPTLVAGLVLVALYGPQTWVGKAFAGVGIEIAFARPGIVLALLFVTLPFVVRAVEPVLRELDPAEEEAAYTLGADRFTVFRRVLLPPLLPAIAAGTVQTFARCVAEFGSLAAVSGNIPHRTLVAPVYILGEVEAGKPGAAAAVSVVLLVAALLLQPVGRLLVRQGGGHG
jgi:sulfate transport system permease protein